MIKALGHRVLIKPDKVEDVDPIYKRAAQAGIHLAPTEDRKREQASVDMGIVLDIGATAFKDFGGEAWCSVGDYIAFARHAGKWVKDPQTQEEFLILNDEDVVCSFIKEDSKDGQ